MASTPSASRGDFWSRPPSSGCFTRRWPAIQRTRSRARCSMADLAACSPLSSPAPSLGDVATLVMHAATASARRLTAAEREAAGIGENLIRVSVGLEDPDDIADDLLAAISQAVER